MKTTPVLRAALVTALVLFIALLGNHFVSGWSWSFFDFAFAGVMIFGTGLTYLLTTERAPKVQYRIAMGLGLAAIFLLIWINGAVGIIGSEDNPANLLYAGVLAVVFLGSIIARLEARKMSVVMFAAAVAQMLVPTIAFIVWRPEFDQGTLAVFVINGVFAMLFVGSGLLFRQAAGK